VSELRDLARRIERGDVVLAVDGEDEHGNDVLVPSLSARETSAVIEALIAFASP